MSSNEMVLPKGPSRSRRRQNRAEGGRFAVGTATIPKIVAVHARRQTPQEGRRFTAALNLLLTEMVRQEFEAAVRELES
jgi:hypothetical protein